MLHKLRHQTRAANETRTRDPDLGKVALYQLSYFRSRVQGDFWYLCQIASAKLLQVFELTKF